MTPRRDISGDGEDEDLRAYEVDGWRIGYEVEINGVGFVEDGGSGSDDDSSFSDSETESIADSDRATEASPYAEYRTLPIQVEEPVENAISSAEDSEDNTVNPDNPNTAAFQSTSTFTAVVSPPIRKEFEKDSSMSSKTSPDEMIPHQPTNITLDEEKIETIRSVMSGFTLPPPAHMANLDDHQLSEIIKEKLRVLGV
ncbi:hypothetical protein Y032_0050g1948 [Ancylostoma ceylanicum]|uniref:Uncharacterized protein n=1 Tax=Ancylostoma ceylanicum TaxID=53326 RepID=A0A016UA95_9BILA|nr:hypothetical protein Y032_0050g1948 [Ancylostoma ceylanicum]